MNYWDSVGRWINTLLLFIVGIISFDTLFRLLEAQESNVIVGVTRLLAAVFLVPFRGMFGEQEYVLTSLVAVLGYALLVGIALSVLRGLQATRVAPRHLDDRQYPQRAVSTPQRTPAQRPTARRTERPTERPAGRPPARNAPAGRSATPSNARTRNGQQTATSPKATAPRRSDGGAQSRSDGGAQSRSDGAAQAGSDGGAPRKADDSAARPSDSATSPSADPAARTAGKATVSRPIGAVADTAATRKVEPAESDRSDD